MVLCFVFCFVLCFVLFCFVLSLSISCDFARLVPLSCLFCSLYLGGYFCRTGGRVLTYFALDGVHLFCLFFIALVDSIYTRAVL